EIQTCHLAHVGAVAGGADRLLSDFGDQTDDHRLGRDDAHELADGRAVGGARRTAGQLDGGGRAGDDRDAAGGFTRRAWGRGERCQGFHGQTGWPAARMPGRPTLRGPSSDRLNEAPKTRSTSFYT